jgi:hypothetical protein
LWHLLLLLGLCRCNSSWPCCGLSLVWPCCGVALVWHGLVFCLVVAQMTFSHRPSLSLLSFLLLSWSCFFCLGRPHQETTRPVKSWASCTSSCQGAMDEWMVLVFSLIASLTIVIAAKIFVVGGFSFVTSFPCYRFHDLSIKLVYTVSATPCLASTNPTIVSVIYGARV